MKKTPALKILHWGPRVLSILLILFISMFALDIFEEGYSFWELLVGLFMHLIPSFVLIILLIIAWRHQKIGGALFITAAVLFSILVLERAPLSTFLVLPLPMILIGGGFLADRYFTRKTPPVL